MKKGVLVLTRREDEGIQIGDNVTVTIVGVRGSTYRREGARFVPLDHPFRSAIESLDPDASFAQFL